MHSSASSQSFGALLSVEHENSLEVEADAVDVVLAGGVLLSVRPVGTLSSALLDGTGSGDAVSATVLAVVQPTTRRSAIHMLVHLCRGGIPMMRTP
jgi:hypothetical protein